MRTLGDIPVKNTFPCIYWRKDDLSAAEAPRNLHIANRSTFEALRRRKDQWQLIDARGRCFDITGWEEIAPFGGLKFWFERLVGCVFVAPILSNERQLTLDEVKTTLLGVAEDRFRHDVESYALGDIRERLPRANSFLEAVQVVSKAT